MKNGLEKLNGTIASPLPWLDVKEILPPSSQSLKTGAISSNLLALAFAANATLLAESSFRHGPHQDFYLL